MTIGCRLFFNAGSRRTTGTRISDHSSLILTLKINELLVESFIILRTPSEPAILNPRNAPTTEQLSVLE